MSLNIPKPVADALRVVAPTLLIALGGPFGPLAASIATAGLTLWLGPADIPAPTAPVPPGVPQPPAAGAATPAEVVQVIYANKDDPRFLLDLKKVEADLVKYEKDMGFRFAELEVKDRQRAGDFQVASATAHSLMHWGMGIVVLAISALLSVVVASLLLISNVIQIPAETAQLAVGVFGLVGAVTGHVASYGSQVLGFYFGSSAGSSQKSDQIADTVRELGGALGDAAAARQVPVAAPLGAGGMDGEEGGSGLPQPLPPNPVTPMAPGLLLEALPELMSPHRQFEGSVTWALTSTGVSIDGAPAQGTVGEPATIRRIATQYHALICAGARRYGLGLECIYATIATESGGDASARRAEPRIQDMSVGLMQTLVSSARQALGRRDLSADDLLNPETSIMAGAAFIAGQRGITHLDPPKIACGFNAGSIRLDPGEANRWKMRCFPLGTGAHADRWVAFFNDAMRVSAEQGWGSDGTPSYVSAIARTVSPPKLAVADPASAPVA